MAARSLLGPALACGVPPMCSSAARQHQILQPPEAFMVMTATALDWSALNVLHEVMDCAFS